MTSHGSDRRTSANEYPPKSESEPKLDAPSMLKELLLADPGLPNHNPTESYWQHVPHPLSEIQSPTLPDNTDIVVIGSGITGTSVAKFLLEGRPDTNVTILEARTLCSGATGRNGGHLVTFGGAGYSSLKRVHGPEMAVKILRFAQDTYDAVLREARDHASEESEMRIVARVRAFGDLKSFEEVKRSVGEYEQDYPEYRGRLSFVDEEQAHEVCNSMLKVRGVSELIACPEIWSPWRCRRCAVSSSSILAV
jgi:hypothetical protein